MNWSNHKSVFSQVQTFQSLCVSPWYNRNGWLDVKKLPTYLISCADLTEIGSKYFNVNSLKYLFQDVSLKSIFGFMKEIGFFWRLGCHVVDLTSFEFIGCLVHWLFLFDMCFSPWDGYANWFYLTCVFTNTLTCFTWHVYSHWLVLLDMWFHTDLFYLTCGFTLTCFIWHVVSHWLGFFWHVYSHWLVLLDMCIHTEVALCGRLGVKQHIIITNNNGHF